MSLSYKKSVLVISFLLIAIFLTAGIKIVDEDHISREHSNPIDELFPYPKEIEPQVNFWIKIFTRYNSSQVLIHDAWVMDRIYEVVDFLHLSPGKKVKNYVKWRSVLQIKDNYIEQLLFLHRYPNGYPEGKLSPVQQRLKQMLSNDRSENKYLRAASNVRIQFGLSDRFKNGIMTLGKYRPYMVEVFERHNLPLELLAIPLYESSFVLRALSFVSAAGVWQFMPYTARKYMRVNNRVDERYDPLIATEGAARLLKYNFKYSKSWPLAITSYNHGLGGMLNAKRKLGTSNIATIIKKYKSPSFGFASRNFYPEFLAAMYCLKNMYNLYNNIEFKDTWKFRTVTLDRAMTLNSISRKYNVPVKVLYTYNPSFRSPVLSSSVALWKGYTLRLPPENIVADNSAQN